MLKIKKDILIEDAHFKILVRDDQLKIDNKWFRFDSQNKFVCGSENGKNIIDKMYNNRLKNVCLDFDILKNLITSKNF